MSATNGADGRRALLTQGLLVLLVSAVAGLLIALAAARTSPYLALGAVIGLLVFCVLVYYPNMGLMLLAALVPIERVGRLTDDAAMYTVSLMRIAGVLTLGALLLNRLLKRKGFLFGAPLLLYGVFVAFSLLSITYSDDRLTSVQMALTFLGNLLFFFLILNLTKDRRSMNAAILVWLLSTVLTGVYATYDWHFGSGETGGFAAIDDRDPGRGRNTEQRMSAVWEDVAEQESLGEAVRRSMGPTSHAAVFGINLILSLPFFVYAVRVRKDWLSKTLLALGGAFVAYNIFLTNTRSVMLTTGLVCLLCLIVGLVKLSGARILVGVVAAAVLLLLVPIDTYTRSLDLSQYSLDRSATLRIRFAYWEAGLAIIRDHWLTGLGSGNEMAVMEYVRIDAPQASSLHNEYLQTMMEVGVLAGSAFFGFVGLVLAYSFRAAAVFRQQSRDGDEYLLLRASQVAMIAVLFYGLQVDVFHFPLKGWWLIAGFVCVLFRASQGLSPVKRSVAAVPQGDGRAIAVDAA